jgi:predicted nucleic acid-binding protein
VRADRFTAVLDTNVLVGALARNMILSLAEAGLFRPRWSDVTIDQEFERAFVRVVGAGNEALAAKQRGRIVLAFPEGRIVTDPTLVAGLTLPDLDDKHVLAAAIQTKAAVIVTDNLKHFPAENLVPHEIEALSTDDFIADAVDMAGPEAIAALRRMRERFNDPAIDPKQLILRVERIGLVQTATLLEEFEPLL